MLTKITLAVALIAGTASVALAGEADPNLLNRYPGANMTAIHGPVFTTRSVSLGRHVAPVASQAQRYDSAPLISGGGY